MAAPTTHFIQFPINAPSPSGYRHINASGIKVLDISSSGELDFGELNNSSGIVITTPTKCAIWVVDSLGDATQQVFDMKFWLTSITDFVGRGTSYNVWFNQEMSTAWQSGISIDKDDGVFTPESLPSNQNLLNCSGTAEIVGGGQDHHCSQYIYMSVSIDPDTPVGTYGGAGVGTFRYRVTYKYM